MSTLVPLMERNLLEVFGQRNSARRAVAIAEIYTADCTFFEAEERIVVAWEGEPAGGDWPLLQRAMHRLCQLSDGRLSLELAPADEWPELR